jgi:hypothetical protein
MPIKRPEWIFIALLVLSYAAVFYVWGIPFLVTQTDKTLLEPVPRIVISIYFGILLLFPSAILYIIALVIMGAFQDWPPFRRK